MRKKEKRISEWLYTTEERNEANAIYIYASNQQVNKIGKHTFSSSNFFSLKFLRFLAVSSRLSASSESVRCFFLEDVEGGSADERIRQISNQLLMSWYGTVQ